MNKIKRHLLKVLIVTADRRLYDSIRRLVEEFQGKRCETEWRRTAKTALGAMRSGKHDVCLIDNRFEENTGLSFLHRAILGGCRTPLILLINEDDEKLRIEAMQTGAACCLSNEKLDAPLLEKAVGYSVERIAGLSELRESVNNFRNLVETLPVMVYVAEPRPPYSPIYVSPAFEAFGYDLEEWNASKDFWMRLIHPQDGERVLRETDAMMRAEKETDLEYRILDKNGAVHWVHDRGRFVRDKQGKPVCWQGIIIDITEKRRAEEESRRRERLYLTLAKNIPHTGVLLFDRDFRYSIAEVSQLKNKNYTRETLEGKTLWEAFPPQVASEWAGYYRRALDGEVIDVEIETGGIFFHIYVIPVRNEGGEIYAGMILCQDITKRKIAVEALRESEERYREIFENANDLIYIHDLKGNYLSINEATERIIGYTLEEALQLNMRQVVAPEYLDYSRQKLAEKLAGVPQTVYEIDCIAKNGRRVKLEINTNAIYKDGKPVAVQGIARDITERKQTQAALQEREEQYRELLENANDLIFTRDLEGNFTSLNRAGEIITGYTREEIARINSRDVIAPDYLAKAQEMILRIIAGETPAAYELVVISKSGERVPFEINMRLIRKDGKPFGIQGIARDITERKRAEAALQFNEAKMKDLFDNAPTGYHELDREGRIVRINRTELEMLGYQADEMLGKFTWEFVAEPVARRSVLRKLSGSHPLVPMERTFRHKDGTLIPVLLRDTLIKDEDGTITGLRANVQDITEQKWAERALKTSEQKYRLLGEGIMHQIWTAQPDGKLNYVNGRTLEYFGRDSAEMIGDNWQNSVHPDDLETSLERWMHSLKTGENYVTEFRLRRHDGEYFWFQARAAAGRDAEGGIVSWFGTNTDINEQKTAEAKLQHIAGHDTLTNLPNRAKFMNHLARAVRRSEYNKSFRFAVLFLDLDRFKIINDSLGHSIGDKLLVEIAGRLEDCVRPNDIVARLGGDEFTVLLTRINQPEDAVRVANRFLEKLSEPFNLGNYEVFTSASIGIIVSDEVKRQPEDFLRDADTAMYRAKAAGKSRYEIFDREMHIRNINLLQMETDLRRAIERKEFRVFYQPIVELNTGEILEFEALIRWQHPQHGLISPNDFIGIAEETGLIIPIGRWILEEACRQTAEWQARFPKHKQLSVSVNLSAKQLMHPNIIAQIKEVLTRTNFEPRCLKLEVTESMVMENGDKSLAVINDFHALGTSISTDDFGTGYSSLSYLHLFPFNRLKIDRSFVGKMEKDMKSEAIVRTILLLGQNLEIETVAEGIENEHQLTRLRSLGCRFGQGYYFSKPVDAVSAEKILEEGLSISVPAAEETFNYGKSDKQQFIELDEVQ